jgi:hypothetical protein
MTLVEDLRLAARVLLGTKTWTLVVVPVARARSPSLIEALRVE